MGIGRDLLTSFVSSKSPTAGAVMGSLGSGRSFGGSLVSAAVPHIFGSEDEPEPRSPSLKESELAALVDKGAISDDMFDALRNRQADLMAPVPQSGPNPLMQPPPMPQMGMMTPQPPPMGDPGQVSMGDAISEEEDPLTAALRGGY